MTSTDFDKASRDELIHRLIEAERQLAWFKKQIFGQKSEKRVGNTAPVDQLSRRVPRRPGPRS